ncbi:hypothetical protein D1007_25104 [Hordeum vulgare]|nr:hypothetical protein D1007_25104 [Hordeum vulgare]
MRRVMEDSVVTHDECQWVALETQLPLFAISNVAIPELEMAVTEEVHEEVIEECAHRHVKPTTGGPEVNVVVHGDEDGRLDG